MGVPSLHRIILDRNTVVAEGNGRRSCLLCRHFLLTKDDDGRYTARCEWHPRVEKHLSLMKRSYHLTAEMNAYKCYDWEGLA